MEVFLWGKRRLIMPVELFIHRQDIDGNVTSEVIAQVPQLSHADWRLSEAGDNLVVDPSIDHGGVDYRVRFGGSFLSRRGLVPEGSGLTVRLDPYGVGRAELARGKSGERVLLEVRTEAIAEPVFEGGALVGFKPNPNLLEGVS